MCENCRSCIFQTYQKWIAKAKKQRKNTEKHKKGGKRGKAKKTKQKKGVFFELTGGWTGICVFTAPRSTAIIRNYFLAMNGTENSRARNRKSRPKWPTLWAILALYRPCFFTLHQASTLHLPRWGGPCKFRFHSDGCTSTMQPGRSIAANETSGCIRLVSQTNSDVFG